MNRKQLEEMLGNEGLFAEQIERICDEVFATPPFKCHKGHILESHPTEDGWCCACDYDVAVMESRIKREVFDELDLLCDADILKIIRTKGVKHWVKIRKEELEGTNAR